MRRSGSQKHLYMDIVGLMQNGKSSQQTAQEHQNKSRPAIPQPDLRFARRQTAKPKSERGKPRNNHTEDLPNGKVPLCYKSKTCRNELIATQ